VKGVVRGVCEERDGRKSIPMKLKFFREDVEEERKGGSGREEGAN